MKCSYEDCTGNVVSDNESKLADQCMIQHDMIKAQAEIIDELRAELRAERFNRLCQTP